MILNDIIIAVMHLLHLPLELTYLTEIAVENALLINITQIVTDFGH